MIGPQPSDGGGRWVLPDALIRDMHDGGGVEDFQHPTALLQVRRRRLKSGHFGGVIVLESRAGITAIDLPLILVFQPGIVKLFENDCGAVDVSCFGGQIYWLTRSFMPLRWQ